MEEDKKKNNSQNYNEKKESNQSYSSNNQNNSGNNSSYQQKSSQSTSLNTATVQTVNKTVTQTVTATTTKAMDARVAHLYQLIRNYKDKVAEYRKTENKEIKLWKYFWEIGEYVLDSGNTSVMDTFFKEYVHDEDLYDQHMALRFIYECKDVHIKNLVPAFYQVQDSLRRYFADRAAGKKARLFLSVRAVARTFEGHEAFVTWVNGKKSK